MSECIVDGAEPNRTTLHYRTPNGYKAEKWLVVREEIVRCKDCEHSRKDGTLCMFFEAWEPIPGGDEFAEIPADVEPDGFCAWGERKVVD